MGTLLSECACAPQTAMEWAQLPFLHELIEALLKAYQQKLFVTHTVDELLWGYKDEILSLINVFKPDISPYFGLFYGVSPFFFSEILCSAEEEGIPSQILSSLWASSGRRPKLVGIVDLL